jgi:lauroyl/myristoyl acyltransferase
MCAVESRAENPAPTLILTFAELKPDAASAAMRLARFAGRQRGKILKGIRQFISTCRSLVMARPRAMPVANKVRVVLPFLAAPALARLPAALGYRIACWNADLLFRCQPGNRTEIARNLQLVFGNELSPAATDQVIRDWFRLASCRPVDVKRLRRSAQPLRRLVEIRGREHLEAALAAGKGAILCSAHFGSYESGFSLLHASGIPITSIGRRTRIKGAELSSAERRFWELVYVRPVQRHRQRPNIEPWRDRPQVAVQAAAVLRANEVVTILIDGPPLDHDRARAVEVPFLGGRACLLPGVVTLAQLTGAPVLMAFVYRDADYRHQVLKISAPVPLEGEPSMAFGRCAAEVNAAIRRSPAHWDFWNSAGALAQLGLIQPQDAAADKVPTQDLVIRAPLSKPRSSTQVSRSSDVYLFPSGSASHRPSCAGSISTTVIVLSGSRSSAFVRRTILASALTKIGLAKST